MNKKGFSLIELAIVLSIISSIVFTVSHSLSDTTNMSLAAATRKIQSHLRYAQMLAMNTGETHGALFQDTGVYEIYRGSPGNAIKDPYTKEDMVVNYTENGDVSLYGGGQIEFDASGGIIDAGNREIMLYAGSNSKAICVISSTGAVLLDYSSCLGSGTY